MTGGSFQANGSFKGYADSVSRKSWTADRSNAGGPPATVGGYIGVMVATSATVPILRLPVPTSVLVGSATPDPHQM
ncbi:MAG TPA: hypothetical protein VIC60_14465, partial [Thermomicrobiales bacterium]